MKRAYTNGILLDGTEQMEPVQGKVLLTENDKITAIADASVSLDGYEVIDLHGGYLCPGLINLHVHLAGNGKPSAKPRDNAALVRKILSNRLTRAIAYRLVCSYAKLELLGGVTTVRTVGGIAFQPCLLIRFGGTVGAFLYEGGIVCLFKPVRAEIVQQVQTVIGKVGLTLVSFLVVHYFGF